MDIGTILHFCIVSDMLFHFWLVKKLVQIINELHQNNSNIEATSISSSPIFLVLPYFIERKNQPLYVSSSINY